MVKFRLQGNTFNRSHSINTNWIFIFFLILSLVIVILINKQGEASDDMKIQDYMMLQEANQYIEKQKLELALPLLKDLNKKYSNEFMLSYRLGNLYLQMNQINFALPLYTKALDLNPHLVENAEFMYQFATIYLMKEDIKNSIIILDRLEQLPLNEEYFQYVQEMRDRILIMEGNDQ